MLSKHVLAVGLDAAVAALRFCSAEEAKSAERRCFGSFQLFVKLGFGYRADEGFVQLLSALISDDQRIRSSQHAR